MQICSNAFLSDGEHMNSYLQVIQQILKSVSSPYLAGPLRGFDHFDLNSFQI